jgi:ATP-binding cassette subfamily B protein
MSDQPGIKKIFDFSLLRRVFSYAKPYKNRFVSSIILSLVLAVMAPIRPLLINYSLNDIIQQTDNSNDILIQLLLNITLIQVVILMVETLLRFYFSFLTSWLGQTVVKDLRIQVYNKVLHLNLRQFDKTPIGTLTTRTINDIEAINDIFS